MSNKYQTTKKDLEKWFKFGISYWLDTKKSVSGRTSGQPRGLGDILDSFLLQIIETGVGKILQNNFDNSKEFISDDEIKPDAAIKYDPDIIKIKEKDEQRKPKVFIEVKYHGKKSAWIGPRTKQSEAFEKGAKNLDISADKIYIIGGDIINFSEKNEEKGRKSSLLGIFLKKISENNKYFNDFHDTLPEIEIKYALRLTDLKKRGTLFEEGDVFFSSSVFHEKQSKTFFDKENELRKSTKDSKKKHSFEYIDYPHWNKDKREIILCWKKQDSDLLENPSKKHGNFKIKGEKIKFLLKTNCKEDGAISSQHCFIHCEEDINLTSSIFGSYDLKKNCYYDFELITVGRDPKINNNNIFISENYLKELQKNNEIDTVETILKEVATNA
jgi:hypothetical protein